MQPVKHSQQVKRKEVAADNKWGYVMLIAKCVCVWGGHCCQKHGGKKKKIQLSKEMKQTFF